MKRILVGFSGGSDSTALLLLAEQACSGLDCGLTAVHFEHGIRGEAALRDAAFCRKFASARGIDFQMFSLHVPELRGCGESVEAAARRLRLEKWRDLTANAPDCAVLLAHHADDCAENLILRLARGGNVSGVTSPRPDDVVCGVRCLRPLLAYSKAELIAYLRSRGVASWCMDDTNGDCRYDRNRVRNHILPEMAQLAGGLAGVQRSLDALRCDADFLEKTADLEFAKIAKKQQVACNTLAALHDAVLLRVVRRFVRAASGADFVPDGAFLKRLRALLETPSPGVRQIPCGAGRLVREYGAISFVPPDKDESDGETVWRWRETPEIVAGAVCCRAELFAKKPESFAGEADVFYFDAAELPEVLTVRTRRDGDKMSCFGGGVKSLKKLFIDAKTPHEVRETAPVLCADGAILAVFGLRRSRLFPVSPQTREFLRVSVRRETV